MALDQFWTICTDILRTHFQLKDAPPTAVVNRKGIVQECNPSFHELMSLSENMDALYIPELDETNDSKVLLKVSDGKIVLRPKAESKQTYLFQIYQSEEVKVIICNRVQYTDTLILSKLSAMHEELINSSRELHKKNLELEEAYAQIRTLGAILPICSSCKKIRNDEGYWKEVESYISEHTDTQFSHSICQDCMEKEYPREEYPYLYTDSEK
ncbi:hypothetical protein K8I28_07720 [bacterium]|nr:hypothetical protein [bacterium]